MCAPLLAIVYNQTHTRDCNKNGEQADRVPQTIKSPANWSPQTPPRYIGISQTHSNFSETHPVKRRVQLRFHTKKMRPEQGQTTTDTAGQMDTWLDVGRCRSRNCFRILMAYCCLRVGVLQTNRGIKSNKSTSESGWK